MCICVKYIYTFIRLWGSHTVVKFPSIWSGRRTGTFCTRPLRKRRNTSLEIPSKPAWFSMSLRFPGRAILQNGKTNKWPTVLREKKSRIISRHDIFVNFVFYAFFFRTYYTYIIFYNIAKWHSCRLCGWWCRHDRSTSFDSIETRARS